MPKALARAKLGLPPDREVVVFGATSATTNNLKGFDLLVEALHRLRKLTDKPFHLLVFGASSTNHQLPYPATFLGHLPTEAAVAGAFQAADVFVISSRQDNFPTTVLEASACGIPTVGFGIGGIPEMVAHGERGYVARAFDTEDLAAGIRAVTQSRDTAQRLGELALKHVTDTSSPEIVARRYISLYEDLLSG